MIFNYKLIFGSKRGEEVREEEFCDICATLEIIYSSPFIKNPETNLNSMYKIKV